MTHLSRLRKRNLEEIPIVAASEVGRAQTENSILGVVGPVISVEYFSRTIWEDWQDRVIAPYAKEETNAIGT